MSTARHTRPAARIAVIALASALLAAPLAHAEAQQPPPGEANAHASAQTSAQSSAQTSGESGAVGARQVIEAQQSIATLTATSVTGTSATLNLANHTGVWHYKQTAPSEGSCSSGIASGTTTAALSSLTAGTTYAYGAYDSSSCGNTNQFALVTFNTAGIMLSTSKIIAPEQSSATYTVALATAPTESVTVTLSKTGDTNLTFDTDSITAGDQSTLAFTTANWNTAQTVTIAAADDTDSAYGSAVITHTPASSDNSYNSTAKTLTALEGDNDVCAGTTAVGNASSGGLVDDCNALLAAKATLAGTSTDLNWSTSTAIASWTGITTASSRVTQISAEYNDLDGTIPNILGDLTNLTSLELNNNNLTGPIPPQLGSLTNLTRIWLAFNNLTGSIPPELGSLTQLTSLGLAFNNLAGSIPPELGSLTQLTSLGLESNSLTRSIPTQLGNLTNLLTLTLYGNHLSGCVPSSLRSFLGSSMINNQAGGVSLSACNGGGTPPPSGGGGGGGGGGAPDPKPGDSFSDDDGSVFEESINKVAAAGITKGCNADGTLFCPNQPVTRAQMAVFLQRALDLEAPSGDSKFTDSAGFAQSAIDAMAAAGITLGCNADGTLFCPSQSVTRGEMAAFLARALELPTPDVAAAFDDTEGSVFNNAIAAILKKGITRGCDNTGGRFCPNQPVTRGQMATFLARALDL